MSARRYRFQVLVTTILNLIQKFVLANRTDSASVGRTAANNCTPARLESWRCGSSKSEVEDRGNQYDGLHLELVEGG